MVSSRKLFLGLSLASIFLILISQTTAVRDLAETTDIIEPTRFPFPRPRFRPPGSGRFPWKRDLPSLCCGDNKNCKHNCICCIPPVKQ